MCAGPCCKNTVCSGSLAIIGVLDRGIIAVLPIPKEVYP